MATDHEANSGEANSGEEVFGETQNRYYTRQLERQLEGEMRKAGLSGKDIERLLAEVEDNNTSARETQVLVPRDSEHGSSEWQSGSAGGVDTGLRDGGSNDHSKAVEEDSEIERGAGEAVLGTDNDKPMLDSGKYDS